MPQLKRVASAAQPKVLLHWDLSTMPEEQPQLHYEEHCKHSTSRIQQTGAEHGISRHLGHIMQPVSCAPSSTASYAMHPHLPHAEAVGLTVHRRPPLWQAA